MLSAFTCVLARAVEGGFIGAAAFDRNNAIVGIAGEIDGDEAPRIAAHVMHRLKSGDMAERMFAGEVLSLRLEERGLDAVVAVAKKQLFVVVLVEQATMAALTDVRELLKTLDEMLTPDVKPVLPLWGRGGGGSGSGPAELPVVELGVTVGRPRAKA